MAYYTYSTHNKGKVIYIEEFYKVSVHFPSAKVKDDEIQQRNLDDIKHILKDELLSQINFNDKIKEG